MPFPSYSAVRPLQTGARVALVAPAGPLRGVGDVERAEQNVRSLGWEPVVGTHVLSKTGYLAGTDAERLDDLNRALRDPSIDAIWCIRGGYGVTRILDRLDYDAIRRTPKAIIGYSDITALHCAVGRCCEIVTYHAPTARAALPPFSRNSIERALRFHEDPCGIAHMGRTLRGGAADGRVMGGNLALLSALCGTPYAPDLRGAILVLEDVNEPIYRIDRMLQQLWSAGMLSEIVAIGFGQCTACTDETNPVPEDAADGRTLDVVLRELADSLNVPCVAGLPIGHVDEQWTIPLGRMARLDADGPGLMISSMSDPQLDPQG